MKNNKLFNKVLSKSAMLLMVAGITMNSGAAFNIYAQDVATADVAASADAGNETAAAQLGSEEAGSTANESAGAETQSVATARYAKATWSTKYTTSQNCRPNITVRPNTSVKPNRPNTNCPTINKPGVETPDTNKPDVETPDTNKPDVETPDTNKPGVETPDTDAPSVETPDTDTPSTETPSEENSSQASFENEVLRLVNVERAKQGLSALQMDESVRNVARVKATDMYKNNYFSHTSPTYGSPFDMLKKYGISYKAAGENIAKGQTTPAQVVNSWMNSSGHRANILNAKYTHIGIGYEANGNHWVQMFIGK